MIDPEDRQPHEMFDGSSLLGHDGLYYAFLQRKRLRDIRLSAAARGVRVPDPSVPPLNCPWRNSAFAGICVPAARRRRLRRCSGGAMLIVAAFACQFGALVRRRPWRPTARPVRSAILSTKLVWSRRRGAWRFKRNYHVAVYTPLEARFGANGRITAHHAEHAETLFHTSSGHFEINLSRKTRAAVDRWAPRR
jgi:hypothetical protein